MNPYAAAALQAAQWSMANGYAGQIMVDPTMQLDPMMVAQQQQLQQPLQQSQPAAAAMLPVKKAAPIWPPSFEEANAAWDFKVNIIGHVRVVKVE